MADTFIKLREENLPDEKARALQVWLRKPEVETLLAVINSRIRSETAEVANSALQASDGAPLKIELTNEHLRQARRYADFLKILNEIRESTVPFTITKWL
jgi:hypothetical protein